MNEIKRFNSVGFDNQLAKEGGEDHNKRVDVTEFSQIIESSLGMSFENREM